MCVLRAAISAEKAKMHRFADKLLNTFSMGDRGEKNDSVYLVLRLKSRRDGEVSHVSVCGCLPVAVWHCGCVALCLPKSLPQ